MSTLLSLQLWYLIYCTANSYSKLYCVCRPTGFLKLVLNWLFLFLSVQIMNIINWFEISSLPCVKDRHSCPIFCFLHILYNTKSVFSGKRAMVKRQIQRSISVSAEINDPAAVSTSSKVHMSVAEAVMVMYVFVVSRFFVKRCTHCISMEQCISWEANRWCDQLSVNSAPVWNSSTLRRVHTSMPLVSIYSHVTL